MKKITPLPLRLAFFIFFSFASAPQVLAAGPADTQQILASGSEDTQQALPNAQHTANTIILPPFIPEDRLTPLPHPGTPSEERALQAAVNTARRPQRQPLPFLAELRAQQNSQITQEETKNEEPEEIEYPEEEEFIELPAITPNEAFQNELQNRLARIRQQLAPYTIGNSMGQSILRSRLNESTPINPITNEDFINAIIKKCQQRADANGENPEQSLLDDIAQNNALTQSIIYEEVTPTEVTTPPEMPTEELNLLTELEIEQLILNVIALYLEFYTVCQTQDSYTQQEESQHQLRMIESQNAIHSHADDSEQGQIHADSRRIQRALAQQQEANATLHAQIRRVFNRSIELLAQAFSGHFNELLPILQKYAARLANPNDPSKNEFSSRYSQAINDINSLVRQKLNIPEPKPEPTSWFSWVPSLW